MIDRRTLLRNGAGLTTLAMGGAWLPRLAHGAEQFELPSGAAAQPLEALPGKVALIRKTVRPPNFETPVKYFNEALTPNNAFFVRYHLANIPEVDAKTWKLKVGGAVAQNPTELSLDDLKRFDQVEVTAVCQCSGNRRGFSDPHVPGVEWGFGAMGNAKWRGVKLKDVLAKVGMGKDLLEVSFAGADGPAFDKTPDFVKSIPAWKAMEDTTLIALEMNGEPLPHWNGAPARIVVPGWTGTYWMKHLTEINALNQAEKNYWMAGAYRVPKALFPVVQRFVSQEAPEGPNTPITEMVVNSLITNAENGQQVKAGQAFTVQGIAWDGGYGIVDVAVSTDGGASWRAAALAPDLGKYSWRQWSHAFTPTQPGTVTVMARARNKAGQAQVEQYIFNPPGYHNNIVQKLALTVA